MKASATEPVADTKVGGTKKVMAFSRNTSVWGRSESRPTMLRAPVYAINSPPYAPDGDEPTRAVKLLSPEAARLDARCPTRCKRDRDAWAPVLTSQCQSPLPP